MHTVTVAQYNNNYGHHKCTLQDEGLVASPSHYHAMQLRHEEEITPIQTFREILEHVPQPDLPSKVTEMSDNVASSTDQSMQ